MNEGDYTYIPTGMLFEDSYPIGTNGMHGILNKEDGVDYSYIQRVMSYHIEGIYACGQGCLIVSALYVFSHFNLITYITTPLRALLRHAVWRFPPWYKHFFEEIEILKWTESVLACFPVC